MALLLSEIVQVEIRTFLNVCMCESAQTKDKCNFSHMLFFVQNGLEGEISTFGDLRIVVK